LNIESFRSIAATLGGGFFVGVLIGYALKKVIKEAVHELGHTFGLRHCQIS
jgi:uncharacterized membrane protein (Fun14 family)